MKKKWIVQYQSLSHMEERYISFDSHQGFRCCLLRVYPLFYLLNQIFLSSLIMVVLAVMHDYISEHAVFVDNDEYSVEISKLLTIILIFRHDYICFS